MLLADAARILLYGSLPVAYVLTVVTIVHLYLIALIRGIALCGLTKFIAKKGFYASMPQLGG
jgi:hypothetical protein